MKCIFVLAGLSLVSLSTQAAPRLSCRPFLAPNANQQTLGTQSQLAAQQCVTRLPLYQQTVAMLGRCSLPVGFRATRIAEVGSDDHRLYQVEATATCSITMDNGQLDPQAKPTGPFLTHPASAKVKFLFRGAMSRAEEGAPWSSSNNEFHGFEILEYSVPESSGL